MQEGVRLTDSNKTVVGEGGRGGALAYDVLCSSLFLWVSLTSPYCVVFKLMVNFSWSPMYFLNPKQKMWSGTYSCYVEPQVAKEARSRESSNVRLRYNPPLATLQLDKAGVLIRT